MEDDSNIKEKKSRENRTKVKISMRRRKVKSNEDLKH